MSVRWFVQRNILQFVERMVHDRKWYSLAFLGITYVNMCEIDRQNCFVDMNITTGTYIQKDYDGGTIIKVIR